MAGKTEIVPSEHGWSAFDPWRITPVRHTLADHPLLRFEALQSLADRLQARKSVRTHSDSADAGTPFNEAPQLHVNPRSATETIRQIEQAHAWLSLLNIQADDLYRGLVDAVLDQVRPEVERRDPGMGYRAGWIFITSPNAVTPMHVDKEHNFILQILGRKTLHVWDHRDQVVVSEQARDRFHAAHERDLIRWDERFRRRARVFHLEPGQGAYMPSTSPHMVENGPGPSITLSVTYYTDATRRDAGLHRLHDSLRRRGLNPPAVGASPVLDAALWTGFRALRAGKNGLRALRRLPVRGDHETYARVGG